MVARANAQEAGSVQLAHPPARTSDRAIDGRKTTRGESARAPYGGGGDDAFGSLGSGPHRSQLQATGMWKRLSDRAIFSC